MSVPYRVSAMYRVQHAVGARFAESAGWRVAEVYTSSDDEAARARAGIGLCDLSACGKLGARGDAVEPWSAKLTGRSLPTVGHAAWEGVDGGAVLVCRRAADEVLVLTAPEALSAVTAACVKGAEGAGCVHLTDLTSAFAVVDAVGPRVLALWERLIALDLSGVGPLGVVLGELGRVPAIIVRLDHETLPAFRVLVGREYGAFVWTTLGDAGADLGLTPIGRAAHARLMQAS